MNFGINLPVTSWGFLSAEEVVEAHFKKLEETGCVWFSTSNRIDSKKAKAVNEILLSNKADIRYLATVTHYINFKEGGLPKTAEDFCPDFCNNVAEEHWFLVDSIRPITAEELEQFSMINEAVQNEYGNVEAYIENTKRLQVFYFKH